MYLSFNYLVVYYSHSIVKSSLQFVLVCRSLFQFVLFTLSLKNCSESMESNLGHVFRGGAGHFVGHAGSRRLARGLSRCFDHMEREKQ